MGRVGHKRSDRRWQTEDGNVWASKLESQVFEVLSRDAGLSVRRCEKGGADTFEYVSPVRSGQCVACGHRTVVQVRTYTPDLFVVPKAQAGKRRGYYLEIKGYFSADQRSLLRSFLKTGPGIALRLLLQRDGRATRGLSQIEYVYKYLKIPVHVWDGVLPREWYLK